MDFSVFDFRRKELDEIEPFEIRVFWESLSLQGRSTIYDDRYLAFKKEIY